MANQQPFDMHYFFKPSSGPPPPPSTSPTIYNTSPFAPPPPPFHLYPPFLGEQQKQRTISYPTPHHLDPQNPNPGGARLMALLGSTYQPNLPFPPSSSSSNSGPEFPNSANPQKFPTLSFSNSQPNPIRFPSNSSSKLPKGRHLIGDHVVYDIDVRFSGEVQPQLEVTPITKYISDPGLVVGRQIAVNGTYICYGLKLGNIRVLNINTALRVLLGGHTQRISDMAFFAEDVHLLASASIDGRVFIWKINEGPDEEDNPQIAGKIILAIQIVGEGESSHPRVCWHCHKQEILVVAIGNHILKIDITEVGKGVEFSAEEPLKCPIDKLIDGVRFVGKHDGEVTELSMCQWMTTRLASASRDGTIWEDRKAVPLAVLRPHDGQPVNLVTFLTSPHRPDHIILITAGPLNREVKIWTSTSEGGWLLPSYTESWQCTQTLELTSSTKSKIGYAFFNQVVAFPQAGLILLANAQKNAIYTLHIEYGPNPAASRMDYIAEFTVTMPILSLTGTSDSLLSGEVVQVYCVQTQAIQQYALALSQCLPPPVETVEFERVDYGVSHALDGANPDGSASVDSEMPLSSTIHVPPILSSSSESAPITSSRVNLSSSSSPPLSPQLSGKSSGFRSPPDNFAPSTLPTVHVGHKPILNYSVDTVEEKISDSPSTGDNLRKAEEKAAPHDISVVRNSPTMFKHPTHLITPSEIISKTTSSSQNSQITLGMIAGDSNCQYEDIKNDLESTEVEVKVIPEKNDKSLYSLASDLSNQLARDCHVGTYTVDEAQQANNADEEEVQELARGVSADVGEAATPPTILQSPAPVAKRRRRKGKNSQVSGPSSPSPSPINSTDSSSEPGSHASAPSIDAAWSQLIAMKDMLNQLTSMQKEVQKQMSTMLSGVVTNEGRRLEASVCRSMEKDAEANMDALLARFQEENAKREKLERDHTKQITNLITNYINKDLPAVLEKALKKEIAAVGPALARAITPSLEKTISSSIAESFQKGVGDKAVNQLERMVISRLEATVARQIRAQFQTSGKQALQDALRSSLEALVIPAFEASSKAMFEQVDASFQKCLNKNAAAAHQQHLESTHSPLAVTLRDAINSASSITQTLSGELADGQRKFLAIAAAGANSNPMNPLVSQLSNGSLAGLHEIAEAPMDPTNELSKLISEHKYEEAFTGTLQRSDVSIVSWLCSQVDLQRIMLLVPLPLSQGILLALLQQLACDIGSETPRKLAWMKDVAVAINPADPMIAVHVRPILEQIYQILGHHRHLPTTSAESPSIHLLMHVINSVLLSCN